MGARLIWLPLSHWYVEIVAVRALEMQVWPFWLWQAKPDGQQPTKVSSASILNWRRQPWEVALAVHAE